MRNLACKFAFCLGFVLGLAAAARAAGEIPTSLPWSQRMALSEIRRNPEGWQIDTAGRPKWNYVGGVVMKADLEVWRATGERKYFDYVRDFAAQMVETSGTVKTYNKEALSLDNINCAKILFDVWKETGEVRYKLALENFRDQFRLQPRTPSGGFWHKQVYPNQMWLDGLYMGTAFYAQYAAVFNEPAAFDDVAKQFILSEQHTRYAPNGLLFHGWDESRKMFWANPETGCSANFWSRGMGWYAMALVDVLDYFPKDHSKRKELIAILNRLAEAIVKVQDAKTGVWYQVLDLPQREGNYLESTGSAMFVYALLKGTRLGYLPERFGRVGQQGFEGILKQFITMDAASGEIHLQQCCTGAGLGPDSNRRRDGSFAYYVSERIRADDGKGVGAFIMASLENEAARKVSKSVQQKGAK